MPASTGSGATAAGAFAKNRAWLPVRSLPDAGTSQRAFQAVDDPAGGIFTLKPAGSSRAPAETCLASGGSA